MRGLSLNSIRICDLIKELLDSVEQPEIFRVEFPERGIFAFDANGLDLK